MKNCIFVLALGDISRYEYCLRAIDNYSKKYKLPLFLGRDIRFNFLNHYFEKFQCLELLETFDRVLCIDADILPTPNSRNIFEIYDNLNFLYAFHENFNTEHMNRDGWIDTYSPIFEWPIYKGRKMYFNSGCIIYSKIHKNIGNLIKRNQYSQKCFSIDGGEQTAINYTVAKYQIPFESLDHSFNRMDLGNFDENNDRYNADFIHYAGPCKYGNGNKFETIEKDYKELYK